MMNPIEVKLSELSKVFKILPRKVAVVAVNFSKERFKQQAWLNNGLQKWAPRKTKGRGRSDNRAILVKTGRLRRSIRAISVSDKQIVIGTDVPYAQAHNEGGKGVVTQNVGAHSRKAHSRKAYTTSGRRKVSAGVVKEHSVRAFTRKRKLNLPKRQFMGASQALEIRIGRLITKEFNDALR